MSVFRYIAMVTILFAFSALLLSCGKAEKEANPEGRVPVETLFSTGERVNPLLSPDGERLLYLSPIMGTMNIFVADVNTPLEATQLTYDSLFGVHRFVWCPDSRRVLYLRDSAGNGMVRLYVVDVETTKSMNLTPFDNIRAQIIGVDNDYPNSALFAMNIDNPRAYSVYNLDLITGNFKMSAENPGNVVGWLADNNLQVKGGLQITDDGHYDFMVADEKTNNWNKIISWNMNDMMDSSPIRFSGDNKYAFVLDSRDANAGRLIKIELATGKKKVIAEDSIYNVKGAIFNPISNDIQGVTFDGQREFTTVIDSSFGEQLAAIQKIHDGDFFISSRTKDDKKWLIGFKVDDGPVPFYLYDTETMKARLLFTHDSKLGEYKLSKIEPISFRARDGLTIRGYISFPPGGSRENLPMVVLVHDGPWIRDTWGYRPEVQWLTDMGYVCLQINYRGSTGYGKRFRQAGIHQWGGAMQDDLYDGVKWAIDKNYADSNRIAIAGQGYGGYAALMAAARQGDMFAAAIDISGYTSIPALMKSIPDYNTYTKLLYYNRVGNPEMENDYLESISPKRYFDSIQIPVMLVYGSRDTKIPMEDVNALKKSLDDRNIPDESLIFDNEADGLMQTSNRLLYYQTAEQFLNTYVKNAERAKANLLTK